MGVPQSARLWSARRTCPRRRERPSPGRSHHAVQMSHPQPHDETPSRDHLRVERRPGPAPRIAQSALPATHGTPHHQKPTPRPTVHSPRPRRNARNHALPRGAPRAGRGRGSAPSPGRRSSTSGPRGPPGRTAHSTAAGGRSRPPSRARPAARPPQAATDHLQSPLSPPSTRGIGQEHTPQQAGHVTGRNQYQPPRRRRRPPELRSLPTAQHAGRSAALRAAPAADCLPARPSASSRTRRPVFPAPGRSPVHHAGAS